MAMVSLYVLGVVVAAVMALIFKRTAFRGEPVPFIIELPHYRLTSAKTRVMLAWDKAKDFLQRALTFSFAASIVVWFLQTFSPPRSSLGGASWPWSRCMCWAWSWRRSWR